jgi:methylenetetrahydrofolate dehydrogenase (NADP+)/methenyltetrahydrofolate cyclohydrolase
MRAVMTKILNGNQLANRIREKVKARIEKRDLDPGLAVILVGDDPASHTYVRLKEEACNEAGIRFEKITYEADVETTELIERVETLNERDDIHGILVQLPLPAQEADRVIQTIDQKKDVDGFHKKNVANLAADKPAIAPAVALGIMKLIEMANEPFEGQLAMIVGSEIFGTPLSTLLEERGADVRIVPKNTPDLQSKTVTADILIVAVGNPGMITGDMVKEGAVVIDVGTTKDGRKIYGDVDSTSVEGIAGALTPVPGGVGPMTVAMLLVNVLKAYSLQK